MLTITIEPDVFSPPSGPTTKEFLQEYVSALLYWKDVMDEGYVSVATCRAANEALIRCGSYPFRPRLQELISQAGLIEYDSNTIAKLVDTLIGQSKCLETEFGINDVLTGYLQISPNIFTGHSPPELKYESEKCAVMLAILGTASGDPSAVSHGLATGSRVVGQRIRVEAELDIVEHSRNDLGPLPVPPARFLGSTIICRSVESFLIALDEVLLWNRARSNADLETAIKLAIYKSRVSGGVPTRWSAIQPFRMNRRFYESVEQSGALTNDTLARSTLRSIVDALEGLRPGSTHALNTGPGAEDPQQTRGADLAWRRNITYEYHLHYWAPNATGLKEMSCIGPHNSFGIFR